MKRKLVHALAIDYNNIYTICCNKYCPDHIHKYGSCSNIKDRLEYRSSHCPWEEYKEICIRIDETTKRCQLNYYKKNRSMTLSKRGFRQQEKAVMEKKEILKKKQLYFDKKKEIVLDCVPKEPCKVYFD